jgi:hypothetical protein
MSTSRQPHDPGRYHPSYFVLGLTMNKRLVLLVPFAYQILLSQQAPPDFYIDTNQCPGEYCEFGQWKAIVDVKLFSEKSEISKKVAHIKTNEKVRALTGDVHTNAGIFLLEIPFEHCLANGSKHLHQPGEKIYIYTYGSEGYYKFWCNGKIGDGISPETDGKWRLGRWLRPVKSVWWVKIRTSNNVVGWTNAGDSFTGKTHEDKIYEHLDLK